MIVTFENRENFPTKHLSISAIKEFLQNEQSFYNKYVNLNFNSTTWPALLIWKAFHYWLEQFNLAQINEKKVLTLEEVKQQGFEHLEMEVQELAVKWLKEFAEERGFDSWPALILDLLQNDYDELWITPDELRDAQNKYIDWWKSDFQDAKEKLEIAFDNYFRERQEYFPLHAEQVASVEISDFDWQVIPIPLKWVLDLIWTEDAESEDIITVDYKCVSAFSDPENISPWYQLQAWAYYFIILALVWKPPKKMIFDEVLKTKQKIEWNPTKAELTKILEECGFDPYNTVEKTNKKWEVEQKKVLMGVDEMRKLALRQDLISYTPTVQQIVINYEEHPEILAGFLKIFKAVINRLWIMALYDIPLEFLPNPYEQYSWKETWDTFIADAYTWDEDVEKLQAEEYMNMDALDI